MKWIIDIPEMFIFNFKNEEKLHLLLGLEAVFRNVHIFPWNWKEANVPC